MNLIQKLAKYRREGHSHGIFYEHRCHVRDKPGGGIRRLTLYKPGNDGNDDHRPKHAITRSRRRSEREKGS